jgi:hypothetical protein
MSKALPMLDPFDEIKRLYFSTTRDTIERDLARALDLLTRMPTDADRDRAAGYMHGLAELRRDWKNAKSKGRKKAPRTPPGAKPVQRAASPGPKSGKQS